MASRHTGTVLPGFPVVGSSPMPSAFFVASCNELIASCNEFAASCNLSAQNARSLTIQNQGEYTFLSNVGAQSGGAFYWRQSKLSHC